VTLNTRSSVGAFAEIRQIVMNDAALMHDLTAAQSQTELFERVVSLGREHGLDINAVELEEIVRANRRSWLERWLFL
jgi:hypothetical protein